jgi:hypothetical protein
MNALKMHQLLLRRLRWLALTFTIFIFTVWRIVMTFFRVLYKKTVTMRGNAFGRHLKKINITECVSNKLKFFSSRKLWRNFQVLSSTLVKSWSGATAMITILLFHNGSYERVKKSKKAILAW